MEKLELKHLAPYLPYKLKIQYEGIVNLKEFSEWRKQEPKFNYSFEDGSNYDNWLKSEPLEIIGNRVSEIKQIKFFKNHFNIYLGNRHGYLKNVSLYEIKPILKPLSDLTKDNYENILDEFSEVELEHLLSAIHIVLNTDSYLNLITYSQFELLVSNHFDVFGLIEQGLAYDINTL